MEKLIMAVFGLNLIAGVAQANNEYVCKSNTPNGSAQVMISRPYGAILITVKFHNDYLNEDFDGRFKGNAYNQVFRGLFVSAQGEKIRAGLQGLDVDPITGKLHISIYSSDNRIEYGYGLHLNCVRK